MPNNNGMKISTRVLMPMVALVATLLVAGCEQFFTTNLLSSFKRDPSTLTDAQKITYAQSAIDSGDAQTMFDAFNALTSGKTTSQLTDQEKSLAVQLGIGASGVSNTIASALADYSSGGDPTSSLDQASSVIDAGVADQTAAILMAMPSDQVTSDQLILAAASLVLAAGQSAGGVDQLPSTSDPTAQARLNNATTLLNQAQTMLQNSGQSTDLITSLEGLY